MFHLSLKLIPFHILELEETFDYYILHIVSFLAEAIQIIDTFFTECGFKEPKALSNVDCNGHIFLMGEVSPEPLLAKSSAKKYES